MRNGETACGRYILEDRIAMGGMAEIFRARTNTEGFQKQVCIKRILPHFLQEPGFESMFRDEAALAARLQHANIVQVFDFGEVDGTLFLAMELIDGVDLKHLLEWSRAQSIKPSISQCCQVLVDICRGLHYAHTLHFSGKQLGIVHRDVSPHNILVSRSGEVKVADFGIAKAAERSTQTATGLVKGKIGYMAPEQARGDLLDHRADQFAAGAILWEMLTGQKLFSRDSQAQTLMAVLETEVPPPSELRAEIPQELDEIVLKAMAKSPEDRFRDMRDFQQSLGRFIHSLPPEKNDDDIVSWVENFFGQNGNPERSTQVLPDVSSQVGTLPSHGPQGLQRDSSTEPTLSHVDLAQERLVEGLTIKGTPMVVTPVESPPSKGKPLFGLLILLGLGVCGLYVYVGTFKPDTGETIVKIPAKKSRDQILNREKKLNEVQKVKPVPVQKISETQPATKSKETKKNPKTSKGVVLIDIVNGWAEVWLGKKRLGETPLKVELPVGEHELLLVNPETKKRRKVKTTIRSKGNKSLRIQL